MDWAICEERLLEEVKTALRITTTNFDESEIFPLIDSAIADMKDVGIKVDLEKPLHRQAIKHYCKGYFGENPNRLDWREAYEGLRDALSLRSSDSE